MTNTLQIKRGTTVKRLAYTPLSGELVQDLDTKKVYIGDGVTAGGVEINTIDIVAADVPSLDTSKLTSGTLPVARGGTGVAAAVQGGMLYGSSTTAAAFTAAGTAGQALVSNGTGAPTWQTLDMTLMPDSVVKKCVKAATTANITLSAPQTIDGVSLIAGDRVLVKNQTTASANGIYIVQAAAWTRPPDADTISKLAGAIVSVDAGTVNGGVHYDTDIKTTDVLGTTSMVWNRLVDTGLASNVAPAALGVAAAGTSDSYSRADHVHLAPTTITGNAGTATKLQTARSITLTGAVTGTGSFDGSANLSIAATVTGVGAVNGIATLDATGKVPSTQLPSYVDDVLEYATQATFPATGETGKIYVETTGNTTFRWSGSAYVKITSGDVASVAGKTGVVTLVKADVGLGSVDNTADSAKNVLSATKLTTARTINGTAFDGTANITIVDATKAPLASPALTGVPTAPTALAATNSTQLATTAFVQAVNAEDTGSSSTALTLKTARNIAIAGAVTGTVAFNGGADVTIKSSFGDVDLGVL